MGRPSKTGSQPNWDALHETASAQAGCFSVDQAHAVGIGDGLLSYHVKAGNLTRPGRGLFRLKLFPADPLEEYVLSWLWSGRQGVFSHETALQLHELSDALPARHHLSVPLAAWRGRRVRPPPLVLLHLQDVPARQRDWKGPVPLTNVLRTLLDCHEAGDIDFVRQAERQAVARGLIARGEFVRALRQKTQASSLMSSMTAHAKETRP